MPKTIHVTASEYSDKPQNLIKSSKYPFKALIFEGGGATAFGHQGAVEVFKEHGILPQIKYFAGSSSGSMIAAALACGGDPADLRKIIMETNLNLLLDDSPGIFKDIFRMYNKYGWFKGDFLENWMGQNLKQITGNSEITFKQAYEQTGNYLAITAVDMTTGDLIYMTHESTPDLKVKTAVRRSTSLPVVYKPDITTEKLGASQRELRSNSSTDSEIKRYYVDGGLIENYPINFFDSILAKDQVVGFKLMSRSELTQINNPFIDRINPKPPSGLSNYLLRFLGMMLNRNNKMHVQSQDWIRSVKIDVGDRSSLDFNLNDQAKTELLDCGRGGAEKFLAGWNEAN